MAIAVGFSIGFNRKVDFIMTGYDSGKTYQVRFESNGPQFQVNPAGFSYTYASDGQKCVRIYEDFITEVWSSRCPGDSSWSPNPILYVAFKEEPPIEVIPDLNTGGSGTVSPPTGLPYPYIDNNCNGDWWHCLVGGNYPPPPPPTLPSKPTVYFQVVTDGDGYAYFTNFSIGANSYKWYFGDGSTSTQTHPKHKYAASSSYQITLKAYNLEGVSSSTQEVTITIVPRVTAFTYIVGGFKVYFTDTSTTEGIASWDFGNGQVYLGTSKRVISTYPYNGEFTVALTKGNKTTTQIITIDTEIMLAWTDNSSTETGFVVEQSLDGEVWNVLTTTAADVTSYGVTQAGDGVDSSVLNYFRVKATNGDGDSVYTDIVGVICGV